MKISPGSTKPNTNNQASARCVLISKLTAATTGSKTTTEADIVSRWAPSEK